MKLGVLLGLLMSLAAGAAPQLQSEISDPECQTYDSKGVRLYRDTSLFIHHLDLMQYDAKEFSNAIKEQDPLIQVFNGPIKLRKLSPDKGPDNKPAKVLLVQVCGDSYNETPGFVRAEDLKPKKVEVDSGVGTMPPSTLGREIPKLRK